VPGPRPWRAMRAIGLGCFLPGFILALTGRRSWWGAIGVVVLALLAFVWWCDLVEEATMGGHHTYVITNTLKFGFILFILSEIILFFSFFWSWLHSSLAPTVSLGGSWPPTGLIPVDPYRLPLFNTVLLLSRGASVTWAHYQIVNGGYALEPIWVTVYLGLFFIIRQAVEYKLCGFAMSDSVFGSIFYMTTGLHGAHVFVGAVFLTVGTVRMRLGHFSRLHHIGLEMAIWYWHFVDVVWLGLYVLYYVWIV